MGQILTTGHFLTYFIIKISKRSRQTSQGSGVKGFKRVKESLIQYLVLNSLYHVMYHEIKRSMVKALLLVKQ